MTYRYLTVVSVPQTTGILLTHGLATAPDEYWFQALGANGGTAYFSGAPDLTNIRISGGVTATALVVARVAHSIIL